MISHLNLSSGIRDLTGKFDIDFYPSPAHKMKFGAIYTRHRFTPNILTGNQGNTELQPNNESKKYAMEAGLYVQDDWTISDRLQASAGLRYSSFSQMRAL